MTPLTDQPPTLPSTPVETDLLSAVQRVLAASEEPLTLSKIRSRLPVALRQMDLEELSTVLRRQAAANVLYAYPKYRSAQERFWDRPMVVHVAELLRVVLEEQPQPLPLLRRKLPAYALAHAEAVLTDLVTQGRLHRHPPARARSGERFGVRPPDPREYLREELEAAFERLTQLGFRRPQLRQAALELLHDEEWASPPRPAAGAESPTEAPRPAPQPAGDTPA